MVLTNQMSFIILSNVLSFTNKSTALALIGEKFSKADEKQRHGKSSFTADNQCVKVGSLNPTFGLIYCYIY